MLGVLLIFLLVKTPEDIWKYIVIYSGTILMGNAILWTYVPRTVGRAKPSWAAMRQHLYPTVAMFLPQLAIELYVIFDKTMLGFLSDVHEVGFYTQAETISKIPLSLIAVISTVMLPRMSNLFENKMHDEIHQHLNKNMQIVLLFSIGAVFGVAGIANELIPWLLGPGYEESIPLLIMLAPLTLLIGISNVIGRQYLILPTESKPLPSRLFAAPAPFFPEPAADTVLCSQRRLYCDSCGGAYGRGHSMGFRPKTCEHKRACVALRQVPWNRRCHVCNRSAYRAEHGCRHVDDDGSMRRGRAYLLGGALSLEG